MLRCPRRSVGIVAARKEATWPARSCMTHRRHLHRDAAYRAADRGKGLGCARRCADGVGCRGRHRLLRAPRPRGHRGGTVGDHAGTASRGHGACVAAAAESLPFEDQSFDAAMAFATVDHWPDPIAGLREMRRVARRVVVFTFDAGAPDGFVGSGSLATTYLRSLTSLSAGLRWPSWPARSEPASSRSHPLGLRRRSLRGVLAPARGVPGRSGPSRRIGVGQSWAGGRAAGGRTSAMTSLGAVGRTQPRPRRLDAAELGLRLLHH